METIKYKVVVNCITYNHALYIEDTMNGFCIQKTNFPFVCTIVDDCSTDGEQKIINDFLVNNFDLNDNSVTVKEETDDYVLTFCQHLTNKNCFFAVILLKYNHFQIDKSKDNYCKRWFDNAQYMAFCEGDDYWTDPHKLQKQADFLVNHPDYAMCFHPVNKVMNGEVVGNDVHSMTETDFCADQIIAYGGCFCASPSLMVRGDVAREVPLFRQIADVCDYPLQVWAAHKGKVHYMPQIMGCYRIQANSWTAKVKPESNINHLKKRIEWLEEYNRYTNFRYDSAVYCSILDSAMVLYQTGNLSKKDILDMFRHVKLLKINVSFQRKMIVLKQLLSVKYSTIYNLVK